jgi:hypothetical protein
MKGVPGNRKLIFHLPLERCTACFVSSGAIDLKLCTYVPLIQLTSQTKFWPDLILGLITRRERNKSDWQMFLTNSISRAVVESACIYHYNINMDLI